MAHCEIRPNVLRLVSDSLDYAALSKISVTLGKSLYPAYAVTEPATRIHESELVTSVIVSDMVRSRAFVAMQPGVVLITLSEEAQRIAAYLRMTVQKYIVLCTLLGLVQESVLRTNGYLRREDLHSLCSEDCYFSFRTRLDEYTGVFENGRVCDKCLHFYSELGANFELDALEGELPPRLVRG